jgi:hypothetical protein
MRIIFVNKYSLSNPLHLSRSSGARSIQILNEMKMRFNIKWEQVSEEKLHEIAFEKFNFIFFTKAISNNSVFLIPFLKKNKIKIIYDLDDWIFNFPSYSVMKVDNNILDNIYTMLDQADYVTVSTDTLKQKLENYRRDLIVIKNGFSEFDLFYRKETLIESNPPRILFSSTDNIKMNKYSNNFINQVIKFLDINKSISLDVWGDGIALFGSSNQINYKGVVDYQGYRKNLYSNGYLFALIPLGGLEDKFDFTYNSSKSIIKFTDYASLGIPGIYSSTPVYDQCVKNANNGLLVENYGDSWINAMSLLYSDSNLRNKIREKAFEDCFRYHNLKDQASILFNALK